jgi:hypothetical protein
MSFETESLISKNDFILNFVNEQRKLSLHYFEQSPKTLKSAASSIKPLPVFKKGFANRKQNKISKSSFAKRISLKSQSVEILKKIKKSTFKIINSSFLEDKEPNFWTNDIKESIEEKSSCFNSDQKPDKGEEEYFANPDLSEMKNTVRQADQNFESFENYCEVEDQARKASHEFNREYSIHSPIFSVSESICSFKKPKFPSSNSPIEFNNMADFNTHNSDIPSSDDDELNSRKCFVTQTISENELCLENFYRPHLL